MKAHTAHRVEQVKDPKRSKDTIVWTHVNVRNSYKSLNHLWRNDLLFVYLVHTGSLTAEHNLR